MLHILAENAMEVKYHLRLNYNHCWGHTATGVIKKNKIKSDHCRKANCFLPENYVIFHFIKTQLTGNVGRGQGGGIFNDMAAIKILHCEGNTG